MHTVDFCSVSPDVRSWALSRCLPLHPECVAAIDVDVGALEHVLSSLGGCAAGGNVELGDVMANYHPSQLRTATHQLRFGHALSFLGGVPHRGGALEASCNMRAHVYIPSAAMCTPENSTCLYDPFPSFPFP